VNLYRTCLALMLIFTSILCVTGSVKCRTYPFKSTAYHLPLHPSISYNLSEYCVFPNPLSKESLSLNRCWSPLVASSILAIPKDEELHEHHHPMHLIKGSGYLRVKHVLTSKHRKNPPN